MISNKYAVEPPEEAALLDLYLGESAAETIKACSLKAVFSDASHSNNI